MKIERVQTIKNCDTNTIEKAYVFYRVNETTTKGLPVDCNSVKEARENARIKYPKIFN